jgi:hypothetical protein
MITPMTYERLPGSGVFENPPDFPETPTPCGEFLTRKQAFLWVA